MYETASKNINVTLLEGADYNHKLDYIALREP